MLNSEDRRKLRDKVYGPIPIVTTLYRVLDQRGVPRWATDRIFTYKEEAQDWASKQDWLTVYKIVEVGEILKTDHLTKLNT